MRRSVRWLIALLIALGLAGLGALVPWTNDVQEGLPAHDERLNRQLDFLKFRRATNLMAIEAWSPAGGDTAAACAALRDMRNAIQTHGATPMVQPTPTGIVHVVDIVERHLPQLTPPERLDQLAAALTPAALHDRLAALRRRSERPEEQVAITAARRDILALTAAPMQALATFSGGAHLVDGIVIHPDGGHALLPLTVDFPPGDQARTAALMATIDRIAAAHPDVRLEAIGSYRHFHDNMTALDRDLHWIVPVGGVLILLILVSLARSLRGLIAMHLPAGCAILGALGGAWLSGAPVPMPLLGLAASLVGIAVDYGIQMTVAAQAATTGRVHRPLFRSIVIGCAAFGVLMLSPLPTIHAVGCMVVGGLFAAWAAARWLVPDLVVPRPIADPWGRATRPLLGWCEHHPRICLAIAVLLSMALLPGLFRLRVISDPVRLDGSSAQTQAALRGFVTRWGHLDPPCHLVSRGGDLGQVMDAISAVRTAQHLPLSPIELLLPSPAEQARRIAAWNRFWADHQSTLHADFAAACRDVGMKAAAFDLSLYQPVEQPTPVTIDLWAGTPVADVLAMAVRQVPDGWQVAVPVMNLDRAGVLALGRAVDGDVWVASQIHFSEELIRVLSEDLLHRSLLIIAAVVVAVFLLTRRIAATVLILTPVTLAMAWTLGALGWLGIEITPFAVLIAAFVGGAGIDGAVFLAEPAHRQELISPTIACLLTGLAGTSSLLLATHPVLAGTGLMLSLGLGLCLIACVVIIPTASRVLKS
jgi:predicted exporter